MQKELPKSLVSEYKVKIYSKGNIKEENRLIIKEQRYFIFINEQKFVSVMLLPQMQKEFTFGFLLTSNIIGSKDDVESFDICENNHIHINLRDNDLDISQKNEWTVTSGCGGGKVLENTYGLDEEVRYNTRYSYEDIISLFKKLEEESSLHSYTRCVHKAYFKSSNGFMYTCEDIGRHNTIDKVIGAILLNECPSDGMILSTGRLTSEMILKCAKAKIPIVVSRTAPSEEGYNIAKKANITLIGLTSMRGFTVFTGEHRII
jgi:FdhD protein